MSAYIPTKQHLCKLLLTGAIASTLLLTGCDDSTEASQDYSKNLKRGETYLEQGQYKAAIIEAKNAIQKGPQEISSHLLMARIFLEMGQPKAAQEQLEQLPGITDPDYLLTKAEAYNAQRKFHSAEQLLDTHQAALNQADTTRYLALAAEAQLGQGNADQAKQLLQQLLQHAPDDADTMVSLAIIAAGKGDADGTRQHLDEALAANPNNTRALLLKARIDYSNNDLSGAEDALTIALTTLDDTDVITPQRATILSRLADILTQQGRSSEALIYTRILAEALPGQTELTAKFNEALTLLKDGELDQAETLLEEVVAEAPNHQSAGQILGIIKYNRGELEAANSYFADTVDAETAPETATLAFAMTNMRLKNPQKVLELLDSQIDTIDNVQLLGLYGLAALSADQLDKGEAALKKALTLDPQRSRLRLALANAYNTQNKQSLALEQLQAAYQTTANDPYIQKALTQQYLNQGLNKEANRFIDAIATDHSDNVNSLILVGTYRYFKGDNSKAITSLKQALAIEPANIEALSGMGSILIRDKAYGKATDHYRQMIKTLPELPAGYKGLITSLELQNQQSAAIKEITALAQAATNPAPYAVMVEFYARNGQFDQAHELLGKAQRRFADNNTLLELSNRLALAEGNYALSQGDNDRARNSAMKGLGTDATDTRLQTLLINTEIADGNFREASKLTEQLAANSGNLAMLLRGNIASAEKKYPIAQNHYQTLWQNAPSDSLAKRIYSNLTQQQKIAEATAFLDQWQQAFPNSTAVLSLKGAAAIGKQQYSAAITDLERALTLQGDNPSPSILNNLAWAYLQAGDLENAKRNGKKAYTLAPKAAAIADTYGWVLLKSGDKKSAREILDIAYQLAPDNAEIEAHWKEANQR